MLRFGIMGAGRIAKDFCDAAVRAEGAEVVAVASKSTERAESLAKEKNLFLMEAMWSRFLPKSLKVREWVKSGAIGEVVSLQGNIGFRAGDDMSNRFFNPKLGGGVMYDIGVYLIDLLPYFADQKIIDTECNV